MMMAMNVSTGITLWPQTVIFFGTMKRIIVPLMAEEEQEQAIMPWS